MVHMAGCLKTHTMCFKMFRARKFENFRPGLCVRDVTGGGCSFNDSNERLNDSMDGMDGADLVVCSLMDFGI